MDPALDPAVPVPVPVRAREDLAFIRSAIERAGRRVDPHAFHFVHWGWIVLLWYPTATLLERAGRLDLAAVVGGVSLALGIALSVIRERKLGGTSRVAGEDAFVGRQVMWVTFAFIAAAVALSVAGPTTGWIEGRTVPVVWGLAYAGIAGMVGVVYRRELAWGGVAIFLASIAAMAVPAWAGVILGPAMGLGFILPGRAAEKRARSLAAEPR